jgi:hypothetical protein
MQINTEVTGEEVNLCDERERIVNIIIIINGCPSPATSG